jgi:iron complex outermembrane receptor protein
VSEILGMTIGHGEADPFWRRSAASARLTVAATTLLSATVAASAAENQVLASLADLSLEELSNVEITSVSKHAERLSDAPASVFVITSEDIRRSGATSLPDALRLAPNLQVAQVSASGYAISARGFNGFSANKLLVLIDGRSVYSPLFSGVFWEAQHVMLEDVERIEVISGPGGTLWGTNAVNGVINVITRSAQNTQGGVAAAGRGNRETDGALRYGGTLGTDGTYRLYGIYLDRNHTSTADGARVNDAWHDGQVGFRVDWNRPGDQFTVLGNAYRDGLAQPAPGQISISFENIVRGNIKAWGENLTARWSHGLEGGGNLSVQTYYDGTDRTVQPTFGESLDIFDLQVQHSLPTLGNHALVWGAQYRYDRDRVRNSEFVAFLPADVDQKWASLFGQDEVALGKDLRATLGVRVERNDYTGYEVLPTARLAWKFGADHLLWTAVSRTVRAPSRLDRDTFAPGNPPFVLAGGPDFRSETANVYEVGYRGLPAARFSYSITVYHTDYDHLHTLELAPSRTSVIFANQMQGHANGIETWGTYQAASFWRLSAGFVQLSQKLQLKPGSLDPQSALAAGRDPAQSWTLRSSMDLPYQTELDAIARHVTALSNPSVPAYLAVDLRVGWKPREQVELSMAGQNLFGTHSEFAGPSTRSELGPSVFFKILGRFL